MYVSKSTARISLLRKVIFDQTTAAVHNEAKPADIISLDLVRPTIICAQAVKANIRVNDPAM